MNYYSVLTDMSDEIAEHPRVIEIRVENNMCDDKFPNKLCNNCKSIDSKPVIIDMKKQRYEDACKKYKENPENETFQEKRARLHNQERTRAYNKLEHNIGLEKTKLCNSIIKGEKCKHRKCRYAHSVDELVIPMCFFGKGCRKKDTCKFPHTEKERSERQVQKREQIKKLLYAKSKILKDMSCTIETWNQKVSVK